MESRDKILQQFKEAADKAADKASFPAMDKVWARVEEKLDAGRPKNVIPFRRMAVAAALMLLICSGTIYFLLEKKPEQPAGQAYAGTQAQPAATAGKSQVQQAPAAMQPAQAAAASSRQQGLTPAAAPGINQESGSFIAAASGDKNDSFPGSTPGYHTAPYPVQPAAVPEDDRRRYTGSVATVAPGQISSRPVTDIVAALEAMSPAVPLSSGAGQPPSGPQIQIRGGNTFGNYTAPSVTVKDIPGSQDHYKVYAEPAPELFGATMRTITGKISDAEGNGIPGVRVSVKGAAINTVTNIEGEYVLRIPLKNDTLLIAGMGADTNNVVIGSSDDVSVMVASFPREFKKTGKDRADQPAYRNSTGTIASRAIGSRPAVEKTAGLPAAPRKSSSGTPPGAGAKKTNTEPAAASPLVIVDGKPYDGTLQSIDPDVIRTVTILKDAEGTAVYSSRGKNSVIIVTTINSDSTTSAVPNADVRQDGKKRNVIGRTAWKIKKVFRKK